MGADPDQGDKGDQGIPPTARTADPAATANVPKANNVLGDATAAVTADGDGDRDDFGCRERRSQGIEALKALLAHRLTAEPCCNSNECFPAAWRLGRPCLSVS